MPETRKITRNQGSIWVQDGEGKTLRILGLDGMQTVSVLKLEGANIRVISKAEHLGAWALAKTWTRHSLSLWFQDMAAILRGGR